MLWLGFVFLLPKGVQAEQENSRLVSTVNVAKQPASQFAFDSLPLFRKSHLKTKWSLSTWRFKEGLNDSLGVLLKLNLHWEKELLSNFLFITNIDLRASQSRLQQHIFGKSSSGVYFLREAKLVVIPKPALSLGLGVLSEGFWDKDLLVNSSSSFIGIRGSFNFMETKSSSVNLYLEQSIPPSSSSDSFRLDNEALPYFLMSQLNVNYTQEKWSVKSHVFYSGYFKLPAVVAYESSLLGNSVIGDNVTDSSFAWDFGLVGGGVDYYSQKGFGVKSYFIWNHKAERSVGKSRFFKLYFDQVSVFSQDLTLDLEEFFIEPDATVSYYNSSAYGNTNREGFSVALSWKIKSDSKIKFRYIRSELINKNSIQDTLQSVSLGLEAKYEFF